MPEALFDHPEIIKFKVHDGSREALVTTEPCEWGRFDKTFNTFEDFDDYVTTAQLLILLFATKFKERFRANLGAADSELPAEQVLITLIELWFDRIPNCFVIADGRPSSKRGTGDNVGAVPCYYPEYYQPVASKVKYSSSLIKPIYFVDGNNADVFFHSLTLFMPLAEKHAIAYREAYLLKNASRMQQPDMPGRYPESPPMGQDLIDQVDVQSLPGHIPGSKFGKCVPKLQRGSTLWSPRPSINKEEVFQDMTSWIEGSDTYSPVFTDAKHQCAVLASAWTYIQQCVQSWTDIPA